jgi:hypothetical protein
VKARLLFLMGMIAASSRTAQAGPWSIEPRLGLATDYETNPLLLQTGGQSEEHVAAIIDLPLRYDTDEVEFLLRPNGRLTNSQGYASLASNYEHLDTAIQYTDELDTASLQGEVARDSSLYFIGGLNNRVGVPRDNALTSGDWTHSLTERGQIEFDASWQRVRYVAPALLNELVDYRYYSGGPSWVYTLSERNTLKLIGNYGYYQALNGTTQSTSENAQVAFVRQLTEVFTLSTSAGYSKSANTQHAVYDYFGFSIPVTQKSNQDGTVYAASVSRHGEQLNFSAGVSRALQPTGLAFLSRQDSYTLTASYVHSERWDFQLSASYVRALNPQVIAGEAQFNATEQAEHYLNTQLTANWHWTPQWTVSMTATRISEQFGPPTVSAASTGVSLTLFRQFLRTQF